jgi:hypothetical protein
MKQYEFTEIEEAILKRHPEIQITYENQLYWILIGKKVFFGDIDGNISLHFSTPEELINAALIKGKKLSEIWNEVIVESFEG